MAQKKKSSQYQRSRKTSGNSRTVKKDEFNEELVNEITLIVILALALLLFLCNFGILGTVGNAVSNVMFGLFGLMAYVFPIIVTYMFFFGIANKGNPKAIRRNSAITVLVISIGMICQMFQGEVTEGESLINKSIEAFKFSYENHKAGGILSGQGDLCTGAFEGSSKSAGHCRCPLYFQFVVHDSDAPAVRLAGDAGMQAGSR